MCIALHTLGGHFFCQYCQCFHTVFSAVLVLSGYWGLLQRAPQYIFSPCWLNILAGDEGRAELAVLYRGGPIGIASSIPYEEAVLKVTWWFP